MKKLVSGVLTIPNSNADCKKVFSVVKKIQTSMRSNLNNSTLNAWEVTAKLNVTDKCYASIHPSKQQLRLAKQACVTYKKDVHA